MTVAEAGARNPGVAWFGWVLGFVFVLTPLIGWLSPLGFAPLAALGGLLSLRGLRFDGRDRPAALAVLVLVAWALASVAWSPFSATSLGNATALKLLAQGLLYWSLFRAASDMGAGSRQAILRIFAWGMALLGATLVAEALTGAGIYQALRTAIGDPIRPDLAVKNVAQAGFVLAVLTPTAAAIALVLSLAAGWATWRWPVGAPRVVASLAGLFFLLAPWIVQGARMMGWFQALEAKVPLSWSMRMSYWRHAADWITDHPFRGWGIDASRMFAPGIKLHPHNGALQVWLELGLIGATAIAVFWFVAIANQGGAKRDLGKAAAVGTAAAYLTFTAVSFGIWQEWWLAVGALAATGCMAVQRQDARENA